jgi:hypothetical protein
VIIVCLSLRRERSKRDMCVWQIYADVLRDGCLALSSSDLQSVGDFVGRRDEDMGGFVGQTVSLVCTFMIDANFISERKLLLIYRTFSSHYGASSPHKCPRTIEKGRSLGILKSWVPHHTHFPLQRRITAVSLYPSHILS